MKNTLAVTAVVFLGLAFVPASAQEGRSNLKGPPHTMGDEGKLPATGTVTDRVPDQRGPNVPVPGDSTSGPSGPKGPQHTMGDEGKLPATGTVTDRVPDQRGPTK